MATKVTFVYGEKALPFSSLKVGDKFMYDNNKMPDAVYMKISNLHEVCKDRYLKNSVNIITGMSVEIQSNSHVVPVDLEIKVIK